MKKFIYILIFLTLGGCMNIKKGTSSTNLDNLLWLEKVEGDKAINWVKAQNKVTDHKNKISKNYNTLKKQALEILEDKNKIPYMSMRGNYVYNFWQDKNHAKGIWRRTTLNSYKSKNPRWTTLIDVDLLAKKENENWVFKETDCFIDDYDKCLIHLSRGGKDATVIREFNLKTKKFVTNGFQLPEAKSWVSWRDKDSLYVGTDFGKDTMTKSGYPKIVKIWNRNTSLSSAKEVFSGINDDMGVYGYFMKDGDQYFHTITQYKNFYASKKWSISKDGLKLIPLQDSAKIEGLFNGFLIVSLKKDWTIEDTTFKSGSALAVKRKIVDSGKVTTDDILILKEPSAKESIQSIRKSRNKLIISTIDNVRGKIYQIDYKNKLFTQPKLLNINSSGDIRLSATDDSTNLITFYDEGFLQPRSLNLYNLDANKVTPLKSLKAKFNINGMTVEQRWATSKDGTKIPYFIVGKKEVLAKGNAPTELYGYGGFNISSKPYYNDVLGKLWLEKNGVYVLANIRGGGEFGPSWHQSAILKNKHKSYEDFISVAEHLISTGVTSNSRLAISGGSNGGLLVGAVMVKRPDLFNSVICQVPLLDMLRYHKLLAGASWMAEYGDPDKPDMREYILTYSPYQNVKKNVKYPNVLFMTSTKDDRVHPGHARKMAARMMEQGHQGISYYENTEGGHSASSDLKQRAKMKAIKYNFLLENLK